MPKGGYRIGAGRPFGSKDKKPRQRQRPRFYQSPLPLGEVENLRTLEEQLREHLGGNVSVVEGILIQQTLALKSQLDAIRQRAFEGSLTDRDERTYPTLLRAFLEYLKEIGPVPKFPNLGFGLLGALRMPEPPGPPPGYIELGEASPSAARRRRKKAEIPTDD
jgi:hypothetical protein